MKRFRLGLGIAACLVALVVVAGCMAPAQSAPQTPASIKVGFVYLGSLDEEGWVAAQEEGRAYLTNKMPNVTTIPVEKIPAGAEAEAAFESLVAQGCPLIFSTSYEHQADLLKVAARHPEVKFMQCCGTITSSNVSTYFGHMEQADYLNGMVAGSMSKTNTVGFVASYNIPEVVRDINAFALGVRSVNPKATIKVAWSGTWYDSEKERSAAESLLAEGCDVLAQNQSTEAVQQAVEAAGRYAIGYNVDMHHFAPQANLTSAIWNWGPYYVKTAQSVMNGTWKAEAFWGGLDSGIVDIAPLSAQVPADVKKKVETARSEMIAQKRLVFSGPINGSDGQLKVAAGQVISDPELLKMNWLVEGVEALTPEAQAVTN